MARAVKRKRSTRRTIGNILFAVGAALLIAGPWFAKETLLLASCLAGGIVLFALAEAIAPFPE
jgi:hypothetical protein